MYFPSLIPLGFLSREAQHVQGFAKECAVVTHARLETDQGGGLRPAPDSELREPLVIRPTSETMFGDAMASWIKSYRDLPMLLNQWGSVMRWEMRPRLFLRTSEFLWQEGHTAHESEDEAMAETSLMIGEYSRLAEEVLAIPVIMGEKTPGERFPGAERTFTIEAMAQDGKAIQAGTSHFLAQNFARAYGIRFVDRQQRQQWAWTTSWGLSTRMIGTLIMTHADDDGLVLPPRIAPQQVLIVPYLMDSEAGAEVLSYCEQLRQDLMSSSYAGESLRVVIDRSAKRGAEKSWDAIRRGIPIRLEVGPRDVRGQQVTMGRRDRARGETQCLAREQVPGAVCAVLETMQRDLFERARQRRAARMVSVEGYEAFREAFQDVAAAPAALPSGAAGAGFVVAPVDVAAFEQDATAQRLFAELKISPRVRLIEPEDTLRQCVFTGAPTRARVAFARAY